MLKFLLIALTALVLLTSGCVFSGAGGTLQIKMTDQASDISSLMLTISKIEVHATGNETPQNDSSGIESNETDTSGWITVIGPKSIDLVKIKSVEELIGEANLSEGTYTQIRISVIGATVTKNNLTYPVKIPSNTIKFVHPFEIKANETTTLLIDFNADQSIAEAGNKYILKPTVKISTESTPSNASDIEQACINSGGNVTTQLCCQSANDFPNTCLVGACGCSSGNSHEIKVCSCPEDECFDGSQCAPQSITIYCVDNNCSPQKVPTGAGTLAQGCYRNLNSCLLGTNATCLSDSDCAGSECCHPTRCINKAFKGVCDVLCTQVCLGPLDCGAGSCKCVNNICAVVPSTT